MTITAQSFRQFFEVPRLGDEATYRRARLLNFLVNLHLVIALIVSILFTTIAFSSFVFPLFALASCLPTLGVRVLIHQGRIRLAASIFLGLMTLLMPLATLVGKGSIGTVTVTGFQFITIVMASLLLDEIEVTLFVMISLLINGILLYAEFHSLYPIESFTRAPLTLWVIQAITYSAGAMLVWMANQLIKESFQRANLELAEHSQAKQHEHNYRTMLEKVISLGKTVTEVTDFETTLRRIWDDVRTGLDFDRVGIFLYIPDENILRGSYGTNRIGEMIEEWDLQFKVDDNSFFKTTLSRPDGYFFTDNYAGMNNLPANHMMAGVKYNAAVACWSGNKPLAIISVDQLLTNRPITEEQVEALRLFAGYAGLAIENARFGEREKYRREMLERVIHLGKTVTEAADFRTTLKRIWDGVRNGLDFDRVGIWLYDSNKNIMTGSYGTSRFGEMTEEWEMKFPVDRDSFFDQVLSRPDGFYFTDDYQGVHHLPPGHDMAGVKYNAAVGCWSGDKPVAILSVDKLITNRPITEDQLEALRLFAGYAGLAIENARLDEQETLRRKRLEEVIQLGKAVTEAADFRTTLTRIWGGVRNGLDFDRMGIFIYDPVENIMQGSYGTDRAGKMTDEWDLRIPLDPGSLFDNALSRPDGYSFTEDFDGTFYHLPDMTDVKHSAVVACWSGDKPIAIIAVDQLLTNRPITKDQLEALRLFAGYAGLAIQNSRLNSELEERVIEREKFIDELGSRNAELERFTYTVSHELKSPIVTIKNFLGIIDRSITEKKYETAQKDFHRIIRAANNMYDTLSDLLELSRIGRVVNPYENFNIAELVQEALESTNGRIHIGHITINTASQFPVVYGDRVRLREVFENLIDNAAKYMGDQASPVIEIGVRDENEPVFYVKDNGMGIDPQYHAKVFGLFEKLDPTSNGTGIGLALIKRIIEVHGGKMWVESKGSGKGSTFCFTIPDTKK